MTTELQQPPAGNVQRLAGKYLTFRLSHESYGISVLQVREIIRLTGITPVPQLPPYVRGVLNLRGKIIPVIDLRLRFGFTEIKDTDLTCIIVVQTPLPGGRTLQMGMIVDGVEEVTNIGTADIEQTPDFGATIATDYILGMATLKGAVKVLLNVDRVLRADTMEQLHQNVAN